MLLDEPLVNLDYKLREELRDELRSSSPTGDSTVVYATTEPTEALLLGGYTAVLDAGELLQYGPTAEVFHAPQSMRVARAFSDPPMNLIAGAAARPAASPLARRPRAAAARCRPARSTALTVGVRASALRVAAARRATSRCRARSSWPRSPAPTPSSTSTTPIGELVAQLHRRAPLRRSAQPVTLYLDPTQVYVFDAAGELLRRARPAHGGRLTWHASTSTWRTPTGRIRAATRTTRCCR